MIVDLPVAGELISGRTVVWIVDFLVLQVVK